MKSYILPVRDMVVQPGVTVPIFTDNPISAKIMETAAAEGTNIVLVAQRIPNYPTKPEEIFNIGSFASILQVLNLPDGTVHMLTKTTGVVNISDIRVIDGKFIGNVSEIPQIDDSNDERTILLREKIVNDLPMVLRGRKLLMDKIAMVAANYPMGAFIDSIVQAIDIDAEDAVIILAQPSYYEKLLTLAELIGIQVEMAKLEDKIQNNVNKKFNEERREIYLREKIGAMQKELGEDGEDSEESFKSRIEKSGMPKDVKKKAMSEWKRLRSMSPMSSEAAVIKTYLDELVAMPWDKSDKSKLNLSLARDILDREHSGMKIVKERILEHLVVMKKTGNTRGSILCLVGSPGVGKTSLGQSIAQALGRKYHRISLGGISDEAHFRGHRKTYIGSQPGRIMDALKRSGTNNPVIVLDEIDKMGRDYRGDPEAALLEVLDPEQNKTFRDHYLEVDFDLSGVLFIATANSLNISPALKDRMEIIEIPSYTEDEKIDIARNHLIRRAANDTGWILDNIVIDDSAIRHIIRNYTSEDGVRELRREITAMLRRALLEADGEDKLTEFTSQKIDDLLRARKSVGLSKRIGFSAQ